MLDSIYVPDSRCMGESSSGSGENLEGGGKEMTGEFISRENGDCGEKESSDLYEGILETITVFYGETYTHRAPFHVNEL